ncbi:hypothetical protein EDD18DRAFT_1105927 [Armillaria luteobubalina]|uniref:Uncharacterized protein n=1 Tax=Armillaria luteobubalina TaxID=153913 RepID=A0AA39TNM9_9AGAR|nr:hypothetical protein EDD18DRAFT_1105927 [Armillaria luteobubalina]
MFAECFYHTRNARIQYIVRCSSLVLLSLAVTKHINGLKDDLKDARNGDWYFWDFVNELHCGICNKDLNGAYRIPASPAEIPSMALAYGNGSKRMYEGPFYNCKVVNLLQMLSSEEERPASYDWEVTGMSTNNDFPLLTMPTTQHGKAVSPEHHRNGKRNIHIVGGLLEREFQSRNPVLGTPPASRRPESMDSELTISKIIIQAAVGSKGGKITETE